MSKIVLDPKEQQESPLLLFGITSTQPYCKLLGISLPARVPLCSHAILWDRKCISFFLVKFK